MRLQTFNMHCQQQRGLKKVVMRFLQKETKSHATITWKPSHPRMVRPSSSRKLLPSPKQVCTHTSPAESIFPNLRQRVPSRLWYLTETLLGVRIAKCRSLALRCRAGCKCRGVGTGRASCKPRISGSVWPHRALIAEHPACSERRCRGAGGPSCGLPGPKLASHRIVCTQHLLQYSAILQHKRSSKQTGARGGTSAHTHTHKRRHTRIISHQRLQASILALSLGVAPPNCPDRPEPADAPG